MKSTKQCFGCHGLFDVDDDIASSRRTSLHTLARDHEMDKSDIPTIRAFYDLNKKCYDTSYVGIVLSFVSLDIRRDMMKRGMVDFLNYYLWICCIHK